LKENSFYYIIDYGKGNVKMLFFNVILL